MRYTPDNIEELAENQIFVFGSNESGRHGAGAALLARRNFGAKEGVGFGFTGQCYAIPTKDENIKTLPLEIIQLYVDHFYTYTQLPQCWKKVFLVTKIGCGLAGYKVEDIAPLFLNHHIVYDNVILPEEFWLTVDK